MAYGAILGQTPTASNVTYNNSQTSSIITGTNVQQAIDQLFTSVSNGKAQIASAITDKGVSTSANDSFAQMAANIGQIESGGFTAVSMSLSGSGQAQVYDYEKKQWIALSSSETTVKISNFLIVHKGSDIYSSAQITSDEEIYGIPFSSAQARPNNYLWINPIDYPIGFAGFTNVKVILYYERA